MKPSKKHVGELMAALRLALDVLGPVEAYKPESETATAIASIRQALRIKQPNY